MTDRGMRRYHSGRIVRKRIKQLVENYWGRKGEFGWDNLPADDTFKLLCLKTAKSRHPFARNRFGDDDNRDEKIKMKDIRRGALQDGLE